VKCSREIKTYITRHRKHLKACHWDDLVIILKMQTCKKNFKRKKVVDLDE
jgi:hypothetical protein